MIPAPYKQNAFVRPSRLTSILLLVVALFVFASPMLTPTGQLALYLTLHFCLCTVYLYRTPTPKTTQTALILAIAIPRLLLLWTDPFTSNDVYRYLWDGHVFLQNIDPYQTTPIELQAEIQWPVVPDNQQYPTLYPPLAIYLFALAASLGPAGGLLAWKILVTLCSSILCFIGACKRPLWLALSPVLLLEGSVGAHLDIVYCLPLLLAMIALQSGKIVPLGIWLAIATGIKTPATVVFLPMLLFLKGRSRRRLALSYIGGLLCVYGTAVACGLVPIGSLLVFLEHWRFGSPLIIGAEAILPNFPTVAVFVIGTVLGTIWIGRRYQNPWDIFQLSFACFFLLSPVVFTWYLAPLAMSLAFRPRGWIVGWLAVHALTYQVLPQFWSYQQWAPATWPLIVICLSWLVFPIAGRIRRTCTKHRTFVF